jgi:hypothetical protein
MHFKWLATIHKNLAAMIISLPNTYMDGKIYMMYFHAFLKESGEKDLSNCAFSVLADSPHSISAEKAH